MEAFYSKPFAALVNSPQAANRAVNHHYTLGVLSRGGGILLDELPEESGATVELDLEQDQVRVLSDGVHVDASDKALLVRPKGTVRRLAQKLEKIGSMRVTVSAGHIQLHGVPVPVSPARLKQLKQEMPAQLALAANTLNFCFAALTAGERFKAADAGGKFWICYDLGTGALSVADSVRALSEAYSNEFRSVSPLLKEVSKLKKVAGKALTFVDAMRNFYGGYTLLFESGDMGYELRSAGALRASAVFAKGGAQIVLGGVQSAELLGFGALAAGGGEAAAVGAASLPVTTVIAIGAILVVCAAEVYLTFTADAEPEIAAFRRALDDALHEQGPSPDAEQQSADPTLRVTRQLQTFAKFIEASALR
jgi:hypothetical protein